MHTWRPFQETTYLRAQIVPSAFASTVPRIYSALTLTRTSLASVVQHRVHGATLSGPEEAALRGGGSRPWI